MELYLVAAFISGLLALDRITLLVFLLKNHKKTFTAVKCQCSDTMLISYLMHK